MKILGYNNKTDLYTTAIVLSGSENKKVYTLEKNIRFYVDDVTQFKLKDFDDMDSAIGIIKGYSGDYLLVEL